ncbi:putative metal-binding motif-containing protein [Arenimonas sp.]|uniref:putative metal-binding motif-containing protein n=1 Tax=Arenimonas sp. TaxID=1872635 RepID=UPI0035B4CA86
MFLIVLLMIPVPGAVLAQSAKDKTQVEAKKPPAAATLRPGIARQVKAPVTMQQEAFQRALGVRGGVSFEKLRSMRLQAEADAQRRRAAPEAVVSQNDRDYHRQPADCDDRDRSVHPGQAEVCNFKDDNCDGMVDEGVAWTVWRDRDGDGFGDPGQPVQTCPVGEALADVSLNNRDCDDSDRSRNPSLGTCP